MNTYRFIYSNNHIIAEVGEENKPFLIDTGSQVSISYDGDEYIELHDAGGEDRTFPLLDVQEVPGFEAPSEGMDDLMGMHVHGIIGLNILREFGGLTLYPNLEQLALGSYHLGEGEKTWSFPIDVTAVRCAGIADNGKRFILDTGAKDHYILSSAAESKHFARMLDDYNPVIGKIFTEMYDDTVTIGGKEIAFTAGKMVPLLEDWCRGANVEYILGIKMFLPKSEAEGCLVLDFNGNKCVQYINSTKD